MKTISTVGNPIYPYKREEKTKLVVETIENRDFSTFLSLMEKDVESVDFSDRNLRGAFYSCLYTDGASDFIKWLVEKKLFVSVVLKLLDEKLKDKQTDKFFRKYCSNALSIGEPFYTLEVLKCLFANKIIWSAKTASALLDKLLDNYHLTDYENLYDCVQFLIDNGAKAKMKIVDAVFIGKIEHRKDGIKIVALLIENGLKCKYTPKIDSHLYALQNEEILKLIKDNGCKLNKKSPVIANLLEYYKESHEPKLKAIIQNKKFDDYSAIDEIHVMFCNIYADYGYYPMTCLQQIESELNKKLTSFLFSIETLLKGLSLKTPGEIVFDAYRHRLVDNGYSWTGEIRDVKEDMVWKTKMQIKIREIFMMILCQHLISAGIDISYKDKDGNSLLSIAELPKVGDFEFAEFLRKN